MQFQLPQHLQTELLAYDPKLKALTRQASSKTTTKKAKYPHGNVNDLIPVEVVRVSLQQDAVDNINANPASSRYHLFTKLVDVATPQARTKATAILYHYEQCWYAAWLPPKGKEQDYVYGYAIAFKDTAAAQKTVSSNYWRNRSDYPIKQYGRTQFYVYTKYVTTQDIINGDDTRNWRGSRVASYYQKSKDLAKAVNKFEESLKESIPCWSDSHDMFGRIKATTIFHALEIPCLSKITIDSSLQFTSQNLMDVLQKISDADDSFGHLYALSHSKKILEVKDVLNTPFFRRWMQEHCDQAVQAYNNPETQLRTDITKHYKIIVAFAEAVSYVRKFWPDCPVDFFQSHIDQLLGTRLRDYSSDCTEQWLRQHMPVASFFQMLRKFHDQAKVDYERNHHSYAKTEYGIAVFGFGDWDDTVSMLSRILNKCKETDQTFAPPKRWRIEEFHDYVQAESWKLTNPNEMLPQDLFPEPTKIELNNQTWTFFQPHDTHQLAMWGQAVRNCVGSASHYADDCKKKKHFIVLCMIDGKPQFTIQLTVDMGMMSVKQIAGIANKRLDDIQKDQYTKAFGLALQSREAALKSRQHKLTSLGLSIWGWSYL
jgi:hypothetical protein